MIYHSISHGIASVLTVLGSNLLVQELRAAWPSVSGRLGDVSLWLAVHLPLDISANDWNRALVALVLGLFWGSAFWLITVRPVTWENQK